MFEPLDYLSRRSQQICTVFLFTLIMQKILNFFHSGWIGFTVMMIYGGYDAGSSLQRTLHRFWGSLCGLLVAFVLIGIIRLHYTLILFIIPCILFMAFFSLGTLYVYPTVFTVTLAALGLEYYPIYNYHIYEFLFDYGRSTLTALGLCIFFEYFIFKRDQLTPHFYLELQRHLIQLMQQIIHTAQVNPHRQSQFLKLSAEFNARCVEFTFFLNAMPYDYYYQKKLTDYAQRFQFLLTQAYQGARELMITPKPLAKDLAENTLNTLAQLQQLHSELVNLGDNYLA